MDFNSSQNVWNSISSTLDCKNCRQRECCYHQQQYFIQCCLHCVTVFIWLWDFSFQFSLWPLAEVSCRCLVLQMLMLITEFLGGKCDINSVRGSVLYHIDRCDTRWRSKIMFTSIKQISVSHLSCILELCSSNPPLPILLVHVPPSDTSVQTLWLTLQLLM